MSAPAELLGLIERFEQQLDSYKSGAYNEAQLRIEFLDPFLKLLGWDMDNTARLNACTPQNLSARGQVFGRFGIRLA